MNLDLGNERIWMGTQRFKPNVKSKAFFEIATAQWESEIFPITPVSAAIVTLNPGDSRTALASESG